MEQNVKDFSLHIVTRLGRSSWALGEDCGDTINVVASGIVEGHVKDAEISAILIKVIDAIDASEHRLAGGLVDLHVFHASARAQLAALGGEFGPLRSLTRSQMARDKDWERPGFDKCLNILGVEEYATDVAHVGRVIEAATDGSVRCKKGRTSGSYGWIRDDGRYGMGTVETGDITVAELTAIFKLLSNATTGERFVIYTDSKAAIGCLDPQRKKRHSNTVENLVRNIKALLDRGVSAEVVWVKSHNGHGLNEGADRLARLARQTEGVTTTTTRAQIAHNIVEECLQRFASAA